ncbi:DUF5685 family protein [Hominifimenecus sp. rT4P-3]|uniref:DUF5685 family protein n=1 Tax=Hominifimenecus sp. rT4P-3 TaxID=3242979 RepID=UPI003DA6A921
MFGYITVNKPELLVKDFDTYRAYYCGLCHALKKQLGKRAQLTLSYDMTFLAILLTGLYEPKNVRTCHCCLLHPAVKHPTYENPYLDYAAAMNLLLSYYNLLDNWRDERSVKSRILAIALRPAVRRIKKQYPRQTAAVCRYLRRLSRCEQESSTDLDYVSGLTGEMLGEIFVYQEDSWAPILRRMAFFLGKFIYLMDALDDLEKDRKDGLYNPWAEMAHQPDFQKNAEDILTMMMGECSLAFERLPILKNTAILRNVLYSGVWSKYEKIKENQKHV